MPPRRPATPWAAASKSLPPACRSGLGSYVQWDRKLDGRLAQALMSIPAIKAVGIGLGPEAAARPGSRVHDEIVLDAARYDGLPLARPTNNAGGLEGGVTNGEDLRVSGVDEADRHADEAAPLGRSDHADGVGAPRSSAATSAPCRPPRWSGEAMVALTLADALVEKFGGDSISELTPRRRQLEGRRRRPDPAPAPRAQDECEMLRPILRYGERPLHAPAAPVDSASMTSSNA